MNDVNARRKQSFLNRSECKILRTGNLVPEKQTNLWAKEGCKVKWSLTYSNGKWPDGIESTMIIDRTEYSTESY